VEGEVLVNKRQNKKKTNKNEQRLQKLEVGLTKLIEMKGHEPNMKQNWRYKENQGEEGEWTKLNKFDFCKINNTCEHYW